MKAYIYKIKRKDYEFEVYVGQTVKKLNERLWQHFKKPTNIDMKEWLNIYRDNIEIISLEEFDYENIKDIQDKLNERETYWTNLYKNNNEYKCFTKYSGNTIRTGNQFNKKPIEVNGIKYESIAEYVRQGGNAHILYEEIEKEWRIKNKEKLAEYHKEYEKRTGKGKEYREKNKEKLNEYNKSYHKEKKNEVNARRREERKNNPEKFREQEKIKHEENKEKINTRRREERKNNPEKFREQDRIKYYRNNEKRKIQYDKNKDKINARRRERRKNNKNK